MNEKDLTPFEQELLKRLDTIDQRLDAIETDIREISSHISRINSNVEILATSQGFPYSHKERTVYRFDRKVS